MLTKASSRLPDTLAVAGYDPLRDAAGYWFDDDAALRAILFFETYLVHVKGELAGQPIILELWQRQVVANLFGWKSIESGLRRYNVLFLYVPRKNSKSTMAAGLALLFFFGDGEPGAEVYTGAADREQAAIVFGIASEMVELSPRLRKNAVIRQHVITRRGPETGLSTFKALSSEVASKHGYNAHAFIADEVHAHRDAGLVEVMTTSMAARRQPVTAYLTTADFARKSLCNDKLAYARGVRDGRIADPHQLPIIYETMPDEDWTDPAVWRKANPNFGISVNEDYIVRECERAKAEPSYENTFRRLHLNCQTEQAERWIRMESWNACGELEVPELEDLEGRPAVVGVDLATTNDIAAVVLLVRDGENVVAIGRYYCPEARVRERDRRNERPSYRAFAASGALTITDGNVIDYNRILADLEELCRRFDVRVVAIDPWNAHAFAASLQDSGVDVEFVRQGFASLSPPSKEFERLIQSRRFAHRNCPVLEWMAANVSKTEDPAGNIKPDKKRSAEKIDGIVATVMGVAMLDRLDTDAGWDLFGL